MDSLLTTQSDLLELAKQGNAQAIASLMNLTLQPKGVTAKTAFQDGCLHIFFYSKQLLSQSAIVQFVQHGLAALETPSIRQVKIYAQKSDADQPVWTDSFRLGFANSPSASPPIASSHPVQHPPTVQMPQPNPVRPTAYSNHPTLQTEGTIALQLPHFAPPGTPTLRPRQSPSRSRSPHPTVLRRSPPSSSPRWQFIAARQSHRLKTATRQLVITLSHANKYAIAGAIATSAFLCGGIVALITSSQAHTANNPDSIAPTSNQLAFGSKANQSPTEQQADAKLYLIQMYKAQQSFYQTNNRFASSLEELERSAAIMSQSNSYSYQFTLRDLSHAELTASPKSNGLKSYTSLTSLNVSAKNTAAGSNLICETNQPTKTPPVITTRADGTAQCAADSTPVIN